MLLPANNALVRTVQRLSVSVQAYLRRLDFAVRSAGGGKPGPRAIDASGCVAIGLGGRSLGTKARSLN